VRRRCESSLQTIVSLTRGFIISAGGTEKSHEVYPDLLPGI